MLADVPENSAFQASHAYRSTVRHGPQPGALAHIGADDVSYFAGEQRGQHTTSGQGAVGGHFLSLGFPLRLEEREDLRERSHRAIVGLDVVQTGGLRLRAGGGHTFDGHHHLIPQKEGIMHRRAHTDVGDDAGHQHRRSLALAQVEIKVSAKERAIAAFRHDNVLGRPMQGVHKARAPGVDETVRDAFLEQGIIGTQPLIRIKDGEVGRLRGIY